MFLFNVFCGEYRGFRFSRISRYLDLKAYKSGLTLALDSLDCLDPLDSLGYLELYILQADAECGAYGDVIHAF